MTQQKIVGKVKKEYTPPSDPGWSKQWSLVSFTNCDWISSYAIPSGDFVKIDLLEGYLFHHFMCILCTSKYER